MKEILNILLDFIISYTLIFILYYFFFVFKKTKYNKKKVPVEYYYLVRVYGLDEKKINYKKFLYTSAIINTFIIALTYVIVFHLLHIFCSYTNSNINNNYVWNTRKTLSEKR